MGIYNKHIFPILMGLTLGGKKIGEQRKKTLSRVRGKILEVGFGTGLNLSHYPSYVRAITAIDPNPGMNRKAQKRMKRSSLQVGLHEYSSEKLPFENQTFDSVVVTFTLCSIPDVELALWEIHRVLNSGGKLFFIEHGISNEPKVQKWQKRITPWQKRFADGCHLDRDMASLIENAGFHFEDLKKYYFKGFPKISGFFYQGIAVKD